ncbi:MAG: hypothetical protein HYX47_24540 [Burkholderiales bacterium]|nr:hypothetical protein [Burkholderiales bacterium]
MSELRDARLKRALESAPDAHMLPAAATRHAIRLAARRAVSSEATWWRRLAPAAPGQRMPWNAAFATLLLASLVTLLWRDHEIPGAVPDGPMAQLPAPAQALPAPAAPATPAATSAPTPAPAEPAKKASPRPETDRKPAAPRLREEAAPLAKSAAAPPVEARQADSVASAGSVASERASPMPAPAAPAAAPAARQAAPALAQGFTLSPPWTVALISVDGRTVEVAREQGGRLAALVAAAAAAATGTEPLAEPAGDRIELRGPQQAQATLEISGPQVRWTQGGRILTGRPDPALLQALREELRRLTQR